MPTIAPKQVKVGGVQLEAVLAEAAVFSPAKYPGFEARVRRIGEIAEDRLGLDGAFDFALAYSDAEAMSTELVFSAGLEKNVNFGLSLAPFAVPGMVSIARPILYGWLEYVLGGSRNEDIVYPQRDPTQLEMQVGRIFCAYLCEALFGAFKDLPVAMSADVILPDSEAGERQWIRRDLQFGILYEAALGPITGEIMLVLPLRLLDTLRSGEKKPAPESDRLPDPQWNSLLSKAVNATRLDMVAVLGRRQMTLEDVAGLKVGQVIALEAGARDPLVVESGDRPIFRAQLGRSSGRYTLKFEEMLYTEGWDGLPA